MKRVLVWDIPVRVLHWALAALIAGSCCVALAVDEHAPAFQWHMLGGLAAGGVVLLRLAWGVLGTRHARFRGFPLGGREVAAYFKGLLPGTARRYTGHNPGSGLAAIAMFLLVLGLVATGMGGLGEAGEELHGALAYLLMAVVGAHLAGLIWHTLRHRDGIAWSMVTGRKDGSADQELPGARPVWAMAMLAACIAWVAGLVSAHDPRAATTRLPGLGRMVRLGEPRRTAESPAANRHRPSPARPHDDD